ncbi:MAG: hypothetical protein HPY90_05800 [Syntrophothermus sp.]|uniref:hypothetical protein n=1 Tax=Syntrophothermus sp. TaxID=2736299 RepID=UPI00257C8C31|nr:hypothetical protein [Syntrophothermus sp.]NSW82779.1 hypothetical protein [Syntrophothermus sp.]
MARNGRSIKIKGTRAEREIAKLLGGKRIPLSGSAGELKGDLTVPGLGLGEVKRRKDSFKELYKWLEGRDFLALRADRKPWLVVLPAEKLKELMKLAGSC